MDYSIRLYLFEGVEPDTIAKPPVPDTAVIAPPIPPVYKVTSVASLEVEVDKEAEEEEEEEVGGRRGEGDFAAAALLLVGGLSW